MRMKSFMVAIISVAAYFFICSTLWAATVNLKIAHENAINSAVQAQAEVFKALVEKRTNSQVQITIYPGGTLTASPEELLEQIRNGSVDLSISSTGNVAGFLPDLQFLNLPFLFKSTEHLRVGLESRPVRVILDNFEKKVGVKALALCEDGTGTCITSNKPINSFEDMKGFKIRCMMNPIFIDMYKAFGAAPTPIDWGELYTALQMKAAEGQDNEPYLSYVTKFFEVQNCVAMTNHFWSGFMVLVSNKKLAELTPEQREIITQTAKETAAMQVEWNHLKGKWILEGLKKQGKTVTYPNMEPFIKASQQVYDIWFAKNPQWKPWFEEIQALDPNTVVPKAGLPKM